MRWPLTPLVLLAVLLAHPATAADSEGAATTRLLVVSGLGGDDRFSDAFHEWSVTLLDAARAAGVSAEDTIYLGEDPARDPERIQGPSRRENVQEALGRLREQAGPQDTTWIVLVGHGSFREGSSRLNLPGPDLTDRDYGAELSGLQGKVVFVNTASASGGFLRTLSGENRVVVTATKTPTQRNESVFGEKFVAAFAGQLADGDQNGAVSVLEAFQYARQEVTRHYEMKNLMVTETAILDDDGDGEGTDSPSAIGGEEGVSDGILASRLELAAPRGGAASGDAATRRAALQDRLDQLRRQKGDLDDDVYQAELEKLLLEIATLDRQAREEGGSQP